MVLNKGIGDPKPRVTNIQGTNLKSSTGTSIRVRDMTPITEKQMEQNMENEMTTGAMWWCIRVMAAVV